LEKQLILVLGSESIKLGWNVLLSQKENCFKNGRGMSKEHRNQLEGFPLAESGMI
jgi:hypothetical protein